MEQRRKEDEENAESQEDCPICGVAISDEKSRHMLLSHVLPNAVAKTPLPCPFNGCSFVGGLTAKPDLKEHISQRHLTGDSESSTVKYGCPGPFCQIHGTSRNCFRLHVKACHTSGNAEETIACFIQPCELQMKEKKLFQHLIDAHGASTCIFDDCCAPLSLDHIEFSHLYDSFRCPFGGCALAFRKLRELSRHCNTKHNYSFDETDNSTSKKKTASKGPEDAKKRRLENKSQHEEGLLQTTMGHTRVPNHERGQQGDRAAPYKGLDGSGDKSTNQSLRVSQLERDLQVVKLETEKELKLFRTKVTSLAMLKERSKTEWHLASNKAKQIQAAGKVANVVNEDEQDLTYRLTSLEEKKIREGQKLEEMRASHNEIMKAKLMELVEQEREQIHVEACVAVESEEAKSRQDGDNTDSVQSESWEKTLLSLMAEKEKMELRHHAERVSWETKMHTERISLERQQTKECGDLSKAIKDILSTNTDQEI